MLVSDGRGRVLHVTRKLAELLGKSVELLKSNGADNALGSVLVEPFAQLHRTLGQVGTLRVIFRQLSSSR